VSTCGEREVRTLRDSKVADQAGLKDTHDSTDAGRQVHRRARASPTAAAKIAVSPAVQKVIASNAAVPTVHRHDVAMIVSALQVRPKVVDTSVIATHVGREVVGLSASASLARAVVSSNASALQVRHADAGTIVTVSLVGPIIAVTNAIATHAVHKERDMNAIAMPVLPGDMEWIAIVWPDRRASMAAIKIVSLVRPSVVTSMVQDLTIRRVLHSIRV
jgi:hypothetical protein